LGPNQLIFPPKQVPCKFLAVLGGSQVLTQFSKLVPIDTYKCENQTENRPQVLKRPRTGTGWFSQKSENRPTLVFSLNLPLFGLGPSSKGLGTNLKLLT
jgi:hypothetical protein